MLFGSPRARESLEEIKIPDIQTLLGREVTTLFGLMLRTPQYGESTLDRPRLHYLAGRAMFTGTSVKDEELKGGQVSLDFLWSPEFQGMKGE